MFLGRRQASDFGGLQKVLASICSVNMRDHLVLKLEPENLADLLNRFF